MMEPGTTVLLVVFINVCFALLVEAGALLMAVVGSSILIPSTNKNTFLVAKLPTFRLCFCDEAIGTYAPKAETHGPCFTSLSCYDKILHKREVCYLVLGICNTCCRDASVGRRELVVEAREGGVVEYLDELEAISQKYIKHRLTLSKQRRSALEFDRQRRPGILSIDNDFGENFTIEGARKVQSEHWVTKQATIFASVVSWLSLSEWEKRAGELGVGDEVTVHGEQHGQPVALGSYWLTGAGLLEKSPTNITEWRTRQAV
jgi:hypothetical protein